MLREAWGYAFVLLLEYAVYSFFAVVNSTHGAGWVKTWCRHAGFGRGNEEVELQGYGEKEEVKNANGNHEASKESENLCEHCNWS